MGPLEYLFGQIENARGQIKRRGLLDLPNIIGEEVARRADQGLLAADQMGSVVQEVKESGRKAMTEQGLGLLGAIKAYHGSPHKFDKFSMDKIGTGEGAQAYGHGLYFAENPQTAKAYANALGKYEVAGKTQGKSGSAADQAQAWAEMHADIGSRDPFGDAIKELQKAGNVPNKSEVISQLKEWKEGGASINKNAAMYEVSLRWPDAAREAKDPLGPQHFLDWDKPLAEQGEPVREALSRMGLEPSGRNAEMLGQRVAKEVAINSGSTAHPFAWRLPPSPTGAAAKAGYGSGDDAARRYMRSLGIPGIRYLDAGSRGAGGGTANYVAFDDALVEILKRNGLAP